MMEVGSQGSNMMELRDTVPGSVDPKHRYRWLASVHIASMPALTGAERSRNTAVTFHAQRHECLDVCVGTLWHRKLFWQSGCSSVRRSSSRLRGEAWCKQQIIGACGNCQLAQFRRIPQVGPQGVNRPAGNLVRQAAAIDTVGTNAIGTRSRAPSSGC